MKKMISLLLFIMATQAFAYLPKIKGWNPEYNLSQEQAGEMIFDFYIHYVWWEDEGYECGGDFSNGKLLSKTDETYIIEGNVTVNQNYCAAVSDGYYKVKIEKAEGKYEISELVFDENLEE